MNRIRLSETELRGIISNAIYNILNESEVTDKQLSNAANRRLSNPNSVKIGRTSTNDISTVKMNRNSNYRKSLSRVVIKTFNNGIFYNPKIKNDNQDRCIRFYNINKSDFKNGKCILFNYTDSTIGRKVLYVIDLSRKAIHEMYIETDDLNVVNKVFDLEPIRKIFEERNINPTEFNLPDIESVEIRHKRPRISRIQSNWDWINNGKPRKYKTFDN